MTDFHPYPEKFIDEATRSNSEAKVREGFARKLARIAMDNPVVNLAREAYRYMADLRVPVRYKVMVIAALLYFLAPIDTVPDWVTRLYRKIHEDKEEHGNYPVEVLVKYATSSEKQDRAARAVGMSLMLRRQYFDSLDRWVYEDKSW